MRLTQSFIRRLAGLCGIAIVVTAVLYAFPNGPPPGRTGAPGEPTCTQCHSGGLGGGRVEISSSAGASYLPGVAQQLTVTITDADARVYGFELSARVLSDNSQAGTLSPAPGETSIRVICSNGSLRPAGGCPANAPIEYIQHSAPRVQNTFRVEWTPPASSRGEARIYVAANAANGDGDNDGDDIYTSNFTLAPQAAGPPSFTSASIVNSASFMSGISPGSFVSIFGQGLAPVARSWDGAITGTALPSQLEGVSVTIGGRPTYIAYISPTQLNVLLPTDDVTGPMDVTVTTPQGSSTASMTVGRHAPGFFPLRLDRQYVVATHGDNVLVARTGAVAGVTSRPAQPGETIVMWGTGFGPTTPQAPSGQVIAGAFPLTTPNDLQVTIGGTVAQVAFAGMTVAGVYQINVVVPPGLPNGDHLVRASIGGAQTQSDAFIPVQASTTGLSAIQVSFRLDPWLVYGTTGAGTWASPPVLGPVTQWGSTFALKSRAVGLDAEGQLVGISPRWTSTDPAMVTVAPSEGGEVEFTVLGAGQSRLQVMSGGITRDLVITATSQGGILAVEIAQ